MATFFIIRGVGGIADSLGEIHQSLGENKRTGENLTGFESMILVGGAVALYGSICYMTYEIHYHNHAIIHRQNDAMDS